MATINPHGTKWRAQVNKKDPKGKSVRKSKVLDSKTEAQNWAARLELTISSGEFIHHSNRTLGDLLRKYQALVTPTKKSRKWEHKKINHIIQFVGHIPLGELRAPHIADWRDKRLKAVAPATVNREWTVISSAINIAIMEWEWMSHNPMIQVKRPPKTPSRDRLIKASEIELLLTTMGFENYPNTVASRVAGAFLLAIETAMRQGEIASLHTNTVDLQARVCDLKETKNGTKRRVPLSRRAVELLQAVDCNFNLIPSQIDSNFRKYRNIAGINNLHFHDSRHQAITNLAQNPKVEVLDLARITGITDLKMLMVYYNQTAEEIAKLLD